MDVLEQDGLTPEHGHPIQAVPRGRLYLYLVPLILFPILIFVASVFIVPTRWFALHSGNPYMANIGYVNLLHNADCQVLIYGDSTAMTGLLPEVIHRRTGLSTCNIAEFEGMTAINGTTFVDEYLARNPRPKFIVFMYSPEDLRIPPNWHQVSSFEAITYRIQHYHDFGTVKLIARHPLDTMGWAEQGMRMSLMRFPTHPMGADKLNLREPHNGALPLPGATLTSCDKANHDDAPDRTWLQGLRARYAVDGTKVIIDATPAPPCEFSLPFILAHLPPEVDDIPYPIYPMRYFLASTRLHMNSAGSQVVSNMVADQIERQLGHPVTTPDPDTATPAPTTSGGN